MREEIEIKEDFIFEITCDGDEKMWVISSSEDAAAKVREVKEHFEEKPISIRKMKNAELLRVRFLDEFEITHTVYCWLGIYFGYKPGFLHCNS